MINSESALIKCNKCRYTWVYKGNNPFYVTCSQCKTSINRKNILTPSQLEVRQPALETESSLYNSKGHTNQQSNPSSAIMDLS